MGAPSRHMQISLPLSLLLHFVRIQWANTLSFIMSRIITIVQGMRISFIFELIVFSASAKVSSNKTTAAALSESAEVTNNSSSPSRQHSASSPTKNLNIHFWDNNFLNSSFRFPIVFSRIYCFLHLLKQLLNYFSEWVYPLKKRYSLSLNKVTEHCKLKRAGKAVFVEWVITRAFLDSTLQDSRMDIRTIKHLPDLACLLLS